MPVTLDRERVKGFVYEATKNVLKITGNPQTDVPGLTDEGAIGAYNDTQKMIVDLIMANDAGICAMGATESDRYQVTLAIKKCKDEEVKDLLLSTVDDIMSEINLYIDEPERMFLWKYPEPKVDRGELLSVVERVLSGVPKEMAKGLVSDVVKACDSELLSIHVDRELRLHSVFPHTGDKHGDQKLVKLRSNMRDDIVLATAKLLHTPWLPRPKDVKDAILRSNRDILRSYGANVTIAEKLMLSSPNVRVCDLVRKGWLKATLGRELASGVYWCLYPPSK